MKQMCVTSSHLSTVYLSVSLRTELHRMAEKSILLKAMIKVCKNKQRPVIICSSDIFQPMLVYKCNDTIKVTFDLPIFICGFNVAPSSTKCYQLRRSKTTKWICNNHVCHISSSSYISAWCIGSIEWAGG